MLFIDKYIPTSFDDIKYSSDSNTKLISLAKIDNFPHIIIKGHKGTGKKTCALLFLREKYGADVYNFKSFIMECKIPGKTDPILLNVVYSPYHYQLNLSNYGVYDRAILDIFFLNIISHKIITNVSSKYRIIIIEDADLLTLEAQQSLRRTLETKISNCRFIFIVNYEGYLIDPLYSRCILLCINAPTCTDIFKILRPIAKDSELAMTNADYTIIINKSNRNIKNAIHMLQTYKVTGKIKYKNDIYLSIITLVTIITTKVKSPDIMAIISDIRFNLNLILKMNVSGSSLINMIHCEFMKKNNHIYEICKLSSKYDYKIKKGGKAIYHLEGYCIALLTLYSMHKEL